MKKLLLTSLLGLLFVNEGWSLPLLQLDIQGGTYVGGTDQTTYANGTSFTLYALLNNPNSTQLGNQYFISAAILPNPGNPTPANFGSFSINGVTYSAASGMQYGNPPLDTTSQDLPSHGIFSTWYAEVGFTFSATNTLNAYNVQSDPYDPESRFSLTGTMIYQAFNIDISGLAPGYSVHFDLYDPGSPIVKAPFSHDAQSGEGHNVPDGGVTLILLGTGLIGLRSFRKILPAK